MFCNYFPARKLLKIFWRQSKLRQERAPSSLSECLNKPKEPRREAWRIWLIICLIFPTFYYIHNMLHFQKYRFMDHIAKYSKHRKYIFMQVAEKSAEVITNNDYTELAIVTPNPKDELPICSLDESKLGVAAATVTDFDVSAIWLEVFNFRGRESNLQVFLHNIHPFLMKQKLEYRLFVVEQKGNGKFNKGRLFNAGFKEMVKFGSWHCIVFHDVDLVPLDERILYSCSMWPKQMCAVVEEVRDPTYKSVFGGVTSMTPLQYRKVNGYSNVYWGWGGEDDDMFKRLRASGFPVGRYNKTIARYTSLAHPASPINSRRYKLLRNAVDRYKREGLSTVVYKLDTIVEHHLYTHLLVDVNHNKSTTKQNTWGWG